MKTLKNKISKLTQQLIALQKDFEVAIVDPQYSLQERWNLWKSAPDILKDQGSWISSAPSNEVMEPIFGEGFEWYDHLHVDRYQTVDLQDLVESWAWERMAEKHETEEPFDSEAFNKKFFELPEVAALVEEILKNNLVSFVFDW